MATIETLQQRIAEMQRELKQLQEDERKAKEAALKAFALQWRFTIKPDNRNWDKLTDDTLVWYRLEGELLNADEYKTIGGDGERKQGGMSYLYNKGTKRIALRSGGGMIYIPDNAFFNRDRKPNPQAVYDALAAFISANPNGGDVTETIISNPDFQMAWGSR